MLRKIRYKQQRLYKIRVIYIFILFIVVLVLGLLAVDFNKSYMLFGESRLDILKIEAINEDIYNISILNNNFSLNMKYLNRDINNVKAYISECFDN